MTSLIYESNNNDIKIIDLSKEYTDYKDDIPYAIVTNLSEDELVDKLGDKIEQYSPYIILTHAMYKAIDKDISMHVPVFSSYKSHIGTICSFNLSLS